MKHPTTAALSALLLMGCAPALAQSHYDKNGTSIGAVSLTPTQAAGGYAGATVGVSDQIVLAANTAFYYLDLINNSPTATVCIAFGAPATIAGTTCAAGEITLPPLWHRSWEGTFVPADAIHAMASLAATPITVGAK